MRILTVTNMYPPHHYGGYELSCRDVMLRFEQRGHEVTVLTTTLRLPAVAEADEPGVIRRLRFYWRDHELLSPSIVGRLRIEWSNQRMLRRALRDAKPEVISVWNMGAMSLGLLTTLVRSGVPIVYNVCDDWLDYGPHLDAWTRLFVRRPGLARVVAAITRVPTVVPDLGSTGAFCFVSERTRRHAEARGHRFSRVAIVHSGIDRADFPAMSPPVQGPWGWRLLYVGRLDHRKGIDTIIRALPLLPAEATLELVGQGEAAELERLRTLGAELGVLHRLTFGSAERSALRERYQAADALVFPSTWDEPFGLVPLEAMACGTPVVATGRGGSAEFLADGVNCLLFPAGDEAALAAALHRLAAEAPLRAALVEAGLSTADGLTIEHLAATLEAWHVAAAANFADGEPLPRQHLGPLAG